MRPITKDILKEKIKNKENIQLIDIRETYEWQNGKICELNIPMDEMIKRIEEIKNKKEKIIYCKSGKRSKSLAFIIKQKFNLEISYLEGGYENYIK